MTWEKLTDGTAKIEYVHNKQIFQWYGTTQALLSNPKALELFYDAEAGQLGFRKAFWNAPLRVAISDDLAFAIPAGPYLEEAGIEFEENWDAESQGPITEGPGQGGFDARGIIWVELPE